VSGVYGVLATQSLATRSRVLEQLFVHLPRADARGPTRSAGLRHAAFFRQHLVSVERDKALDRQWRSIAFRRPSARRPEYRVGIQSSQKPIWNCLRDWAFYHSNTIVLRTG
jgi:hypothetical protein